MIDHAPLAPKPQLRLTALPRLAAAGLVVVGVAAALGLALTIAVWMGVTDAGLGSTAVLVPVSLALGVIGVAAAMDKATHVRHLQQALVHERAAADILARRIDMHTALERATTPLAAELDADALLHEVVTRAGELIGATEGALYLLEYGDVLRVGATLGTQYVMNSRRPLGETPVARAVRDQRSILDQLPSGSHVWCAPLVQNGTPIGALELVTPASRPSVATDLHALALFAEPAADAIARVRVVATERGHVEELLELDRMKRAYVSGVGHDLRTPLTSLRGATAALRRIDNPDTQRELLDVIDRQVERLANLAQALIDAEHEHQVETLRLDLPGLVRLIALDSELAGRPVSVGAPEHLDVIADPEAIRRMLTNLIDNAYAHGAPPVSVAVEERSGYAVMTVTDCGGGVAIEERERIFEHAYRGSTHDRSGHGLGLAIVRSLAEACGGTAWVEPVADGGAMFSVSLRMRDVTQQEAAWNLGRVS